MTRNEAIKLIGDYKTRFLKDKNRIPTAERPAYKEFTAAIYELSGKVESTGKPCPGCGKPDQYKRRRVDQVCQACRQKLTNYDALVAQRDRKNEVEAELPARVGGWPYIYWTGQLLGSEKDTCDPNKSFRRWLWKIASLLGRPAIPGWNRPNGHTADEAVQKLPDLYTKKKINGGDRSWYDHSLIRSMTKEEVEAIEELDLAARQMISAVYAQGVQDGQNLPRQIASGEMTAADFNKEALRLQRRK